MIKQTDLKWITFTKCFG